MNAKLFTILGGFLALIFIAEGVGGWLNLILIGALTIGGYLLLLKISTNAIASQTLEPKAAMPNRSARVATPSLSTNDVTRMQDDSARRPNENSNLPALFTGLVDAELHARSGSVFYTGRAAFSAPTPLYVLGLNPGGSPLRQSNATIGRNLSDWQKLPELWSAYADESWEGRSPGTWGMQPRILHLFDGLGLEPRRVPAANVVFVRSATEADLAAEKRELLSLCWPVHEAVLRELHVGTVLCLGGTAGKWVRDALGAHEQVDEFCETNARGWRSYVHSAGDGREVVTVTHPGRVDWRNPDADPTPLVRRAIQRGCRA